MGERVDEVVQEDVVLLKVDVEGHEPGVIQSATGLLDGYRWEPWVVPPPPPPPPSLIDVPPLPFCPPVSSSLPQAC